MSDVSRLRLDFSDLTGPGYSFNKMKGHFQVRDGDAYTQHAYFSGSSARIDFAGRIGLLDKDYDLHVDVIPQMTSGLPVLAAAMGGPVAGVAAWFMDQLLGPGVNRSVQNSYQITGSWDQPLLLNLPLPKYLKQLSIMSSPAQP